MAFLFIHHDDYVILQLTGTFSRMGLKEITRRVEEIESSTDVTPNRVVDVGSVDVFDISFEDVFDFAQIRKAMPLKNPVKSAFIVDRDLTYGMTQMFKTLNDHPQITIRIVRSLAEAEAWFGESPF
ncbi:MAG: hypothetical protein HXX12_01245 [Geothrix sp.]|uniref:hypothetical protein n=1 Tax=Geothrix sp. TaxID=1962974 RepID=UPI0017F6469D|nr:hypothetical protein [Geothrix sp.]NWJ39577.1 hypothetical protein [Geothrix sp.]WIL19202.1 MAG: hypothetical protein QOZ81_001703 [Geothrix sp.]